MVVMVVGEMVRKVSGDVVLVVVLCFIMLGEGGGQGSFGSEACQGNVTRQ